MKLDKILEAAVNTFASVKLGGNKKDPKLAELDRGVMTVVLLVAALDGTILPEEFAAFQTLAKKCRGGSAKNVRTLLDVAVPAVGRLMAMAQLGVYPEKERLETFIMAAEKALPSGFANGSMADLRRAFALWVAMGISDGDFNGLERKAIEALRSRFAEIRIARERREEEREERKSRLSPIHSVAYHLPVQKAGVLEADFIARAETVLKDFAKPAKIEQAESALESLVTMMPIAK